MRFVYWLTMKEAEHAPNIRSNDVDAFDNRPEDGCTNLGFAREADDEERAAGAEIVNCLLVCGALCEGGYAVL